MSKHNQGKGVAAQIPATVHAAIQAGAIQGALVPTIEQYAEVEANLIDNAIRSRQTHWVEVFTSYATDIPMLEKYPSAVRHAYARKLGLNMKVSRKDWADAQRKLYDSFCANQVSPLSLMLSVAVGTKERKGEGIEKVIDLLKGPGTLPAKVTQARIMLGKPVKVRGPKDKGNHGEGATAAEGATKGEVKWDMTDLRKKTPVEVVCSLAPTFKIAEIITTIQACVAKLKTSSDPLEKLLGVRLAEAVKEYDEKNAEPEELEEPEHEPVAEQAA